MRKVILGVAVTLDGFIEGPNGEYDWCFTDQDYGMTDFMKRIDTLFMGRKTYEMANAYEGASPWKGTTTYVFSNTLKTLKDKDAQIINGDVRAKVAEFKKSEGKDIWLFGGAALTTFFINEELIDEYWLSVHPILLGSGKLLFHDIAGRKKLKLVESIPYDTGLISLRYVTDNV